MGATAAPGSAPADRDAGCGRIAGFDSLPAWPGARRGAGRQDPDVATLVYRPGEPDERSYPLSAAALTLGRGPEQDIAIPHKSLSRKHARVELADGKYVVVDLGSKNGTFVNGARELRRELRHGDTVTLGEVDLL